MTETIENKIIKLIVMYEFAEKLGTENVEIKAVVNDLKSLLDKQ